MAGSSLILGISIWLVAKIFILIFLVMYIIFSLVVIKQIRTMLATVDMGLNLPIRLIGWTHFLFAVGIFVIAFLIL